MEADKFEHIVEKRFEGFESMAPESVWEGIDAHLNERKRRFGAFWWFVSFASLAGALGIFYFGFYNNSSASSSKKETQISQVKDQLPTDQTATNAKEADKVFNSTSPSQSETTQNALATNNSTTQSSNNPTTNNNAIPKGNNSAGSIPTSKPNANHITTGGNKGPKHLNVPSRPNSLLEASTPIMDSLQEDNAVLTALPIKRADLLKTQTPNLLPCPAYPTSSHPTRHYFGVQFSSFLALAPPRIAADNIASNANATYEATEGTYKRKWEIEPQYRIQFNNSRFSYMALFAFSQNKASIYESTNFWQTKGYSWAPGLGLNYSIIEGRFSMSAFANARWERQINQISGDGGTIEYSTDQTQALSDPGGVYAVNYKQNTIGIETGIEAKYYFNARWALFGQAAYRNYIWQQKTPINPLIRTPHLLRFGLGVRWEL